MHELGSTRSVHHRSYLLQTPDTFVRTRFPGCNGVDTIVHASPAFGADFVQFTAEFTESGATLAAPAIGKPVSRFVYVLAGSVSVRHGGGETTLSAGGFAYLAPGETHSIVAQGERAVANVIDKPWVTPAPGAQPHAALFGSEADVAPQSLGGDSGLLVRSLLPETTELDFAVNTMEYAPGAALAQVEVHVMEHGLLMLEGGGIYRLGSDWHPVRAGDYIWMAPFCPQWFGAIGKTPAKYLIYKDWNRHPLL